MNHKESDEHRTYPHQELTGAIIGAAIAVHRHFGPGQDERLYEEALGLALADVSLTFEAQKALPVVYKGMNLDCGYRPDVVVENTVVLEGKALEVVLPVHFAQLMTYQRLGSWPVGLLLNFNEALMRDGVHRRIVDLTSTNEWSMAEGTTEERRTQRGDLEEEELTEVLVSAVAEVQRVLGPGLLRSAYSACLMRELSLRGIPFEAGLNVPVEFGGRMLAQKGELPLLVAGRVPLILHALESLRPVHDAQLLAALRLGGQRVGLLVNFNNPSIKDGIRRILNPDLNCSPQR